MVAHGDHMINVDQTRVVGHLMEPPILPPRHHRRRDPGRIVCVRIHRSGPTRKMKSVPRGFGGKCSLSSNGFVEAAQDRPRDHHVVAVVGEESFHLQTTPVPIQSRGAGLVPVGVAMRRTTTTPAAVVVVVGGCGEVQCIVVVATTRFREDARLFLAHICWRGHRGAR